MTKEISNIINAIKHDIDAMCKTNDMYELTCLRADIIDNINKLAHKKRECIEAADDSAPGSWIPVSERLPEELEPVNITWINRNPESYYANIKDKPFTATGVYFKGQWYWWSTLCTDILAEYSHNHDDIIDDDVEITAWMPLPPSYQGEENG